MLAQIYLKMDRVDLALKQVGGNPRVCLYRGCGTWLLMLSYLALK